MKKVLTILMAAALTVAAASQASAAALETKGEYRARFWYLSKYFQTINPMAEDKTDFWDQRLRLYMTWPVAEGVKVQVRADVLEQFWGASGEFQNDKFFTSNNQIDFDWANVMVAVPNTPLTLTVGKQDVSWGTNAITAEDNRYRAKVSAKFDQVTVVFAYDKQIETLHGATLLTGAPNQDDAGGYTLAAVTNAAGFKLGAYVSYTTNEAKEDLDQQRWWYNAFAIGKVGMVDLSAELGYKNGKDKKPGDDPKYSGLGAYVAAKAPAGPATLGLEFAYASGDDPNTSKNEGDLKFDYQGPFWSVILFNNFELPGWESNYGTDFSLSNAWAAKASCAAALMPKLTLYGALVYADRLEDVRNANGSITPADPLGTEVDLIAMYALTQNVNLNVGFGYLFAGDFYGDVDDPWGATAHLVVTF